MKKWTKYKESAYCQENRPWSSENPTPSLEAASINCLWPKIGRLGIVLAFLLPCILLCLNKDKYGLTAETTNNVVTVGSFKSLCCTTCDTVAPSFNKETRLPPMFQKFKPIAQTIACVLCYRKVHTLFTIISLVASNIQKKLCHVHVQLYYFSITLKSSFCHIAPAHHAFNFTSLPFAFFMAPFLPFHLPNHTTGNKSRLTEEMIIPTNLGCRVSHPYPRVIWQEKVLVNFLCRRSHIP